MNNDYIYNMVLSLHDVIAAVNTLIQTQMLALVLSLKFLIKLS